MNHFEEGLPFDEVSIRINNVCDEVGKVMVGQTEIIRHSIAAFLAGGHVLLEDVPGTGKTTLANSIATCLGLKSSRIQGTPDLLPADLTGTMVFHPGEGKFSFRRGPLFTQLLLMDEINRATPRTQSALLEAMAESSISVDGQTYQLEQPFFVMATANPLETQGVFPLPEAQMDRFLVQLKLGYTCEADELQMVSRIRFKSVPTLVAQMSIEQLQSARLLARQVYVVDDVLKYIVRLCRATRNHESTILGASPRAILSLTAFCQAIALLSGRSYVTPDDVQEAWNPVMRHRIRTTMDWGSDGSSTDADRILAEVLQLIPVPVEYVVEDSLS